MQSLKGNIKESSKNYKIAVIIIGSLLYLLYPVFTSPDFNWDLHFLKIDQFQRSFLSYFLSLIFFFVNLYWLLPQYYFKQKHLLYYILVLIAFIVANYIPEQFFSAPHYPLDNRFPRPNKPMGIPPVQNAFQFLFVFILSYLIINNSRYREMEQQKLTTELAYLKAQINPHFLFNSLNSIYALVLMQSDSAPKAVVQLSNMMRYVLQNDNGSFIELKKELSFVNDYVSLQKHRLHENVDLQLAIRIPENTVGLVAPMVFASFIENAFKYGINPEKNGLIKISLELRNDKFIHFSCYNKIVNNNLQQDRDWHGIGLDNTKKRLNFLYKGNYDLSVLEENEFYTVSLKLPLK